MAYMNMTKFVLINYLEKGHSMIEMHCLKNVIILIQTILSFALLRKIIEFFISYFFTNNFVSVVSFAW